VAQTKLATRDANEYVAAVRRQLADVRWRRRKELLVTVRESVDELPVNAMPSVRLGPPATFARDLREGAGLPPRRVSPLALVRGARPRTLMLAVAATVLVTALVAGAVYRANYQPITTDAQFGATDAKVITDPFVTDTLLYGYEPGKVVVTGITVQNTGWATVHVDDAELPTGTNGPLVVRELRATSDPQLTGQWKILPTVTSVSVAPGRTVYVFVVMQMVDFAIGPRGNAMTMEQPTLRTRVLGVHHTVAVPGNKISLVVE
jgi:hypothetical protein